MPGPPASFQNAFLNLEVETVISIAAISHIKALMGLSIKKGVQLASCHGQMGEWAHSTITVFQIWGLNLLFLGSPKANILFQDEQL